MEDLVKLSILCISTVLAISIISEGSRVMAAVVTVAASLCVMHFTVSKGIILLDRIETIIFAAGIEGELLRPVIKVAGIAVCGRMSAELCRDLGSRWAAGNIELFTVILSAGAMLPLIEKVLDIIGSL